MGKPNEADNLTIFPVPYRFRQSKENLFEPTAVSIGPFHHGKESLKDMQDQKWWFLRDFLSRGDHMSLDLCLSEIKKLEDRTRRCYSESVPLDSNSFVQMMLLDGCFVLEYFLKWYERRINSIGQSVFILSDLLLLENQIPFFIVEKLCEIGLRPEDRMGIKDYLNYIFAHAAAADDSIVPNPPAEIHHFIHLCYHSLIHSNLTTPVVSISESCQSMSGTINNLLSAFFLWVFIRIFPKSNYSVLYNPYSRSKVIPCATMLQDAGIEFKPKNNPYHMLDISFVHRVLEIPRLTITNESKTLLANLIAFEQYKLNEMGANLSTFALFLGSLVNTPEDVKILQECGIVNNCLDSDKELIDFFNQICEGMVVEDDHFLAELFVEVDKYCEKRWSWPLLRWNRHKKQFIDAYFRSPWTAISLVGAVLVVLFTFVQTVFAVLAYFVPRR